MGIESGGITVVYCAQGGGADETQSKRANLPDQASANLPDQASANLPDQASAEGCVGGCVGDSGSADSVPSVLARLHTNLDGCRVYRHFDIERMVAVLRITDALKALMALKKRAQTQ